MGAPDSFQTAPFGILFQRKGGTQHLFRVTGLRIFGRDIELGRDPSNEMRVIAAFQATIHKAFFYTDGDKPAFNDILESLTAFNIHDPEKTAKKNAPAWYTQPHITYRQP